MTNKAPKKFELNTVDEDVLIRQLNIPSRLAKRILALRPYQSVSQLDRVWGIDPETLNRILPLVYIEDGEDGHAAEAAPAPPVDQALPPSAPSFPETPVPVREPALRRTAAPFPAPAAAKPQISWKTNIVLILILLVGAYFRFNGLNWDSNHHQHPDERFITMTADGIRGVNGLGAYFDTRSSTLNPLNFGSYTYGMLPLFLTRLVSEWVKMAQYDQITLVGRALSGMFDLAAILMLYLLGKRLYNRRVGLLAAALGAAAVLPIQLSHFFAVDSFSTVFVVASVYFAILAIPITTPEVKISRSHLVNFAIFGFLVGLAGACKVNTLPVFGVIVLAGGIYLFTAWKKAGFRAALSQILLGWGLALLMTFLAFRIFQPYAFSGPGFFGISLNPRWLEVIHEVTDQVAGKSEWPPNHHWTNRPLTYAWTNMVQWGMGLPLGIAGWLGLAWALWRSWKGDWRRHILPVVWTLAYFIWQNIQFWRYMRYFLPIYPFIILFAAWALVEIYDRTRESRARLYQNGLKLAQQIGAFRTVWMGAAGLLAIAVVLLGTYGYAFAFEQIYNRPITRIAASRWILANIPGPMNLSVDTPQGPQSYPISVFNHQVVVPGDTPSINLNITKNGQASHITTTAIRQIGVDLYFRITRDEKGDDLITDGQLTLTDDDANSSQTINFGDANLDPDHTYYLQYKLNSSSRFSFASMVLRDENDDDPALPLDWNLQDQAPGVLTGTIPLTPKQTLRLNRLQIDGIHQEFVPTETTLQVGLYKADDDQTPLATVEKKLAFTQAGLKLSPVLSFKQPVQLSGKKTYLVRYQVANGGPIQITGDTFTLETSWDDALPLDVDQYNALGGIYSPLNLELYEPDTPDKREKMIQILADSDYIVIPSNRSYDAMPRLPLRYPLTLKYYQALFGCNCSGDAMENRGYGLEPPFKSPLGFDLVATFESRPTLGPLAIPDESADESFTVYDHPKVLIFKKSTDFSLDKVKTILNSVDLDQVIFQTPLAYTNNPTAMQLPADRLSIQTNGGTWSAIFNRSALINVNEALGGFAWYLLLLLFGWIVFPLVFIAFPGLPDRGYPLARIAALIVVAWLAWFLGSLKILAFTRLTIAACILLVLVVCLGLAYLQRQAILEFLRSKWKHILITEGIFLVLFFISLTIRLGNPDLWNPWLGGEKPMDFAFFNAILKAVYFPPENPWFSGHYINYYYYGYVIAAIPTKLLGILPSIAFNLILPSWFAMVGVGVFCVGYNLVAGLWKGRSQSMFPSLAEEPELNPVQKSGFFSTTRLAYLAGCIALVTVLFLGNLDEVRVLWKYLPEADQAGTQIDPSQNHLGAVLAGAVQVFTGQVDLPGDKGRWYFEASRPILHDGPDTPIAEFPFFTFLYADLHPHLLSMPIFAIALGWIVSLLIFPLTKMRWRDQAVSLILAGLIFGSFRAVHSWDFPTFAGLGGLAVLWNVWQTRRRNLRQTLVGMAGYGLAFAALAVGLYQPFAQWFKTEYAAVGFWTGARTPLGDYLFVFGLSLFVIITLLCRDLYPDLKSAYRRWRLTSEARRGHLKTLAILLACLVMILLVCTAIIVFASVFDYQVVAFGLPLLAGMVYLIFFKPGLTLIRRITWILFGIGLSITLFVEVFVLEGDVGRSNTVFRFYDQAWFMLGIAMALALIDLLAGMSRWPRVLRTAWVPALAVLVLCGASYPLIATSKKMADRWPGITDPPHTLDGAAFMLGNVDNTDPAYFAIYNDDDRILNLGKDYTAIQFMQDHISGSPVIVEGHTEEYRWGSRFSIYTGLPSIIGWSWHTRQHNSLLDGAIFDKRIDDTNTFYNTPDMGAAAQFLARYHVDYVIVGDLERTYYTAEGIAKFREMANQGTLKLVYGSQEADSTSIYQVVSQK